MYNITIYLITVTALCFAPGPAAILSFTNGLKHGFKKNLLRLLGLQSAILRYIIISSILIKSLIELSGTFFIIIKIAGVIYFLYLGIMHFIKRDDFNKPKSRKNIFVQGFLVNISNPKAILFFVALFPQFIDINQNYFSQIILLGLTFMIIDSSSMTTYSLFSSYIKPLIKKPKTVNIIVGCLFILISILMAVKL